MRNRRRTLTRRQFGLTGLTAAAGLATSVGASGQDVETFKALGLDKRPDLSWLRDREAFNRFLQPPEDNQYHPCAEAHPAADTPRGQMPAGPKVGAYEIVECLRLRQDYGGPAGKAHLRRSRASVRC